MTPAPDGYRPGCDDAGIFIEAADRVGDKVSSSDPDCEEVEKGQEKGERNG